MLKQPWMIVAACAAWLGLAAPAPAATPRVNDEAHLFSPAAVENANRRLQDIQRDFHKDLCIDTVPRVPADLQQSLQSEGKAAFFNRWASGRAKEAQVHGIYILLCMAPGHLEIVQDPATQHRGFSDAERDQLGKQMLPRLQQHKFDDALSVAVDFVAARLRANLGGGRPSASGIPPLGGPVDTPPPRAGNPPLNSGGGPAGQRRGGREFDVGLVDFHRPDFAGRVGGQSHLPGHHRFRTGFGRGLRARGRVCPAPRADTAVTGRPALAAVGS